MQGQQLESPIQLQLVYAAACSTPREQAASEHSARHTFSSKSDVPQDLWPGAQVVEDPVPLPEEGQLSGEFCSFIEACMQKDPYKRPTAEGLLSHPFILKVYTNPPRFLIPFGVGRYLSTMSQQLSAKGTSSQFLLEQRE